MSHKSDYNPSPLSSFEKTVIDTEKSTPEGSVLSSDHSSRERKLVRKLDLMIIFPSFLIYALCHLDRSNISNARILNYETNDSLSDVLALSNVDYDIAWVVFLVAYMLMEVPSNLLLKLSRPSSWIAFLVFSCGAISMGLAAVRTFPAFMGVQFLLGAFEAGILPGLFYLVTFWYKPSERSTRIAAIASASNVSGAIGGLLAFVIGKLNGLRGLQGWRWLFLLQGIPSCIAGVVIYFCFPDYPETTRWLSRSERELAISRLQGVRSQGDAKITQKEVVETLKDWKLYGHYLIHFCLSISFSSLFLFLPSIIHGLGLENLEGQLFTIPPNALSFVATMAISISTDHFGAKSLHSFFPALLASICFLIQALLPDSALIPRYVLLCISAPALFATGAPSVAWLSNNLRSTGASGLAIGLYMSTGALGQIAGAWIYKDSEAPGYITGHMTNFAVLLLGSIMMLFMRQVYRRRNSRLPAGSIPWNL